MSISILCKALIILTDARDGMEYPMITLDGGQDPTYRGLLAHEIGHMWFYGQVGNNETYRAAEPIEANVAVKTIVSC